MEEDEIREHPAGYLRCERDPRSRADPAAEAGEGEAGEVNYNCGLPAQF